MKRVPKAQFELIQNNASKGVALAQLCLGEIYFTGNGVTKDYGEALKWFQKAAEQGHPRAQNKIATCFLKGYGVEKDEAQAYAWILIAKESGRSPWHLRLLAFWVKKLLNKDQLQRAQSFASTWHTNGYGKMFPQQRDETNNTSKARLIRWVMRGLLAWCAGCFIYGVIYFGDAPFHNNTAEHPCKTPVAICGKTGAPHTEQDIAALANWELLFWSSLPLFACARLFFHINPIKSRF